MRNFLLLALGLSLAAPVYADGFRMVGREGRLTEYEGSVSLAGRVERRQDAETLVWRGDRVCFTPDAASAARLPPAGSKTAGRFFCFSNNRSAAGLLGIPSQPPAGSCGVTGTATVVVSRYTVESGENVFDQAWLDRVERPGALTPLACP